MLNKIKEEPVRFWGTLTALVTAIFGVVVAQGGMTDATVGLILVIWAAVGGVFQFFFVRSKVSPV